MVVNFKASGISRGTRKLARTPTLIKKIKRGKSSSNVKNDKKFIIRKSLHNSHACLI